MDLRPTDIEAISRAQGCLLSQLAGDALGSLVEFRRPDDIRGEYPNGVREFADGGTWNTIAGQATDERARTPNLSRLLYLAHGFVKDERVIYRHIIV